MKVTLDTNTMSVDEKGEVLRGLVFDQKLIPTKYGLLRQTGCHETFEVNKGFKKIDPKKYPKLLKYFWSDIMQIPPEDAYESDEIVAMWECDSDVDLLIWIKGERYALRNSDAKHDYGWEKYDINNPD
jgi:hypothetical protein